MFNITKIKDAVDKNLCNSEIFIAIVSSVEIELRITSTCPESGNKFGLAHRFHIMDLITAKEANVINKAERMADSIRLHPDYNK